MSDDAEAGIVNFLRYALHRIVRRNVAEFKRPLFLMDDAELMAAWEAEPPQSMRSLAVVQVMDRMRFGKNPEVITL